MIKALEHNIVAKPIKMPEDSPVKTVDGNHPHYIEVVSIGSNVKNELEPGDYFYCTGKASSVIINEQEYLILTSAQAKFKVDQEDI